MNFPAPRNVPPTAVNNAVLAQQHAAYPQVHAPGIRPLIGNAQPQALAPLNVQGTGDATALRRGQWDNAVRDVNLRVPNNATAASMYVATPAEYGGHASIGGVALHGADARLALLEQQNERLTSALQTTSAQMNALTEQLNRTRHPAPAPAGAPAPQGVAGQKPASSRTSSSPASFLGERIGAVMARHKELADKVAKLRLPKKDALEDSLHKVRESFATLSAFAGQYEDRADSRKWDKHRKNFLAAEASAIANLEKVSEGLKEMERSDSMRRRWLDGQEGFTSTGRDLSKSLSEVSKERWSAGKPDVAAMHQENPRIATRAFAAAKTVRDAGGSEDFSRFVLEAVWNSTAVFRSAHANIRNRKDPPDSFTLRGKQDAHVTVENRWIWDDERRMPKYVTMATIEVTHANGELHSTNNSHVPVSATTKFEVWERNDGSIGVYSQKVEARTRHDPGAGEPA